MILSRLSKSVRRQDWFAAFIEFAIVVLGIFTALQVNEWAQEREDRIQERAALERLFYESRSAYQYLDARTQRTRNLNQLRREAVQFADSSEPIPDNELPLKIGINTLSMFPVAIPVSVAYDELRSSGQMQLIQSPALREQVAEFHVELHRHNQLQANFDSGAQGYFDDYMKHVFWKYNPEATTSDVLLSTYDWESLRSDRTFVTQLIGLLRNQLVAESGLTELRDQAEVLCEKLGKLVDQTCN